MDKIESFSDFISMIKNKAYQKAKAMLDSGDITYTNLFEQLGSPLIKNKYDRLNLPYNLLKECVIPLEEKGFIKLVDSTWGDIELARKTVMADKPTSADMFPDSVGWNNYGGPTYEITLNGNELQIISKFCHQEIEGYSDMNISMVWQKRTFTFYLPQDHTEVKEELLKTIFGEKTVRDWIDKEIDKAIDEKTGHYADLIIKAISLR